MIITSYLFPNGTFSMVRLERILQVLGGDKSKLVIDLSCRRRGGTWFVAMDKWQTITDMEVNQSISDRTPQGTWRYKLTKSAESIMLLERHCCEFLIHAADNEGLQQGIDEELVQKLADWCSIPVTYAGGGRSIEDLERVKHLSRSKVDLTIGSALDIFGGSAIRFADCVVWNKEQHEQLL